jgi:16S rRNA (guanine966-N2)-methyltransferase
MVRRSHRSNRNKYVLRIIGGQWRRHQLVFADIPGLRPTGDRIRETLFNWLQPTIPGSCCLDPFAGSGALGFEAASRGANKVVMLDVSVEAVHHLKTQAARLGANQVYIEQADALYWLKSCSQGFDIIFLDPPFRQDLLNKTVSILRHKGLREGTRIYLETEANRPMLELPPEWEYLRNGEAGQVRYSLATVVSTARA